MWMSGPIGAWWMPPPGVELQTLTSVVNDAATDSTSRALTARHRSSATPAAGFGTEFAIAGEDAGGSDQDIAVLRAVLTTATAGAEVGALRIAVVASGTVAASGSEQLEITPTLTTIRAANSGGAPTLKVIGTGTQSIADFYVNATHHGRLRSYGSGSTAGLLFGSLGTDMVFSTNNENNFPIIVERNTEVGIGGPTTTDGYKLTVNGKTRLSGVIEGPSGTAGAPTFTIAGDADTGMYLAASNTVGISGGGTAVAEFGGGQIIARAGSAATPAITFTGDLDNGLFLAGGNQVGVAAGGSQVMRFSVPGTDNDTSMLITWRESGVNVTDTVAVGAADSGGTGFRALVIPN